jgi:hypothetical protein
MPVGEGWMGAVRISLLFIYSLNHSRHLLLSISLEASIDKPGDCAAAQSTGLSMDASSL